MASPHRIRTIVPAAIGFGKRSLLENSAEDRARAPRGGSGQGGEVEDQFWAGFAAKVRLG